MPRCFAVHAYCCVCPTFGFRPELELSCTLHLLFVCRSATVSSATSSSRCSWPGFVAPTWTKATLPATASRCGSLLTHRMRGWMLHCHLSMIPNPSTGVPQHRIDMQRASACDTGSVCVCAFEGEGGRGGGQRGWPTKQEARSDATRPDAPNLRLVTLFRYWDTRPTAVITRITQLMTIAGSFISGLLTDLITGASQRWSTASLSPFLPPLPFLSLNQPLEPHPRHPGPLAVPSTTTAPHCHSPGRLKEREVKRAIQLRDIVTSLGPAYIKVCITEAVQGQQVVCVCVSRHAHVLMHTGTLFQPHR